MWQLEGIHASDLAEISCGMNMSSLIMHGGGSLHKKGATISICSLKMPKDIVQSCMSS